MFIRKSAIGILIVVLILSLLVSASAEPQSGTCGKNLTWTLDTNNGLLTISGTGEMDSFSRTPSWLYWVREVIIQEGVTSIGCNAFRLCTKLTNITIPDTVNIIGSEVFSGCGILRSITIPDGITRIERSLFFGCSNLTDVNLPNSVTSIAPSAFQNCIRLQSLKLPVGLTHIEGCAFFSCEALSDIAIPESVISIGDAAFMDCSITEVSLSDKLQYIAPNAFDKTVVILAPKGSYAAQWAKDNHYELKEYDLSERTIDGAVYKLSSKQTAIYVRPGDNNVTNVSIPAAITLEGKRYSVNEIAANAFKNCDKLKELTIGKNVKKIGKKAVYGCAKLKKITIKTKSLKAKNIGKDAFKNTHKKITFYCPKKKIADYNKIIVEKGASEKAKFESE